MELLAPLVRFLNDNPALRADMSLINDLKIMVYTIKTVLTGRGM